VHDLQKSANFRFFSQFLKIIKIIHFIEVIEEFRNKNVCFLVKKVLPAVVKTTSIARTAQLR